MLLAVSREGGAMLSVKPMTDLLQLPIPFLGTVTAHAAGYFIDDLLIVVFFVLAVIAAIWVMRAPPAPSDDEPDEPS
jgi:hypothetical protein